MAGMIARNYNMGQVNLNNVIEGIKEVCRREGINYYTISITSPKHAVAKYRNGRTAAYFTAE